MKLKKFDWAILGVLVVIVLSFHIYAALTPAESLVYWYTTDDAYYYFKVAQNVVAGHGFSFDQINLTNGFHPLWLFVCVIIFGIFRADPITPLRAIILVLALLNAGTGIIIYLLLKKNLSRPVAIFGAFFWALFPYIHYVTSMHGLESGIGAFFISLLILYASELRNQAHLERIGWKKLLLLGFFSGLVLLSRLDNVFLICIIGLWVLLRGFKVSSIFVTDAFLAFFGVAAAFIARFGFSPNYQPFLKSLYTIAGLSILFKPLIFMLFGLNINAKKVRFSGLLFRIIGASAASSLLISVVLYILIRVNYFEVFPRSSIIFDFVFTVLLLGGLRLSIWLRKKQLADDFSPVIPWIKNNWKKVLVEGAFFSIPLLLILSGYFTWNKAMFGTLMPISGQIKHWWAILPNTVYSHKVDPFVVLGLSPQLNYGPWSLAVSPAYYITSFIQKYSFLKSDGYYRMFFLGFLLLEGAIAWLIYYFNKEHFREQAQKIGLLPLFTACLVQISYYQATGYPNSRFWYWIAELMVIVLTLAVLFHLLVRWIETKTKTSVYSNIIIGILVAGLIYINGYYIFSRSSYQISEDQKEWYLTDTKGVEQLTPPGAVIGMTGGGTIAYFATDRTIINLDGLMNSVEYFRALQKGTADKFLENLNMKFIFASDYVITSSDPYMTQFEGHLERIGVIKGPEMFTLFRYISSD